MIEPKDGSASARHGLDYIFQFLTNRLLAFLEYELVDPAAKCQLSATRAAQIDDTHTYGRLGSMGCMVLRSQSSNALMMELTKPSLSISKTRVPHD